MSHPQNTQAKPTARSGNGHTPTSVWVWRNKFGRPFVGCDCGWTDKARWLANTAAFHAIIHAAQTGHTPMEPLDYWKAATR